MDLVHTKPTTDVLLHGHAHVPQGKPATQVDVSLAVGTIKKTLRIVGDRHWTVRFLGVGMSDPEPFVKMPITYERRFRGHGYEVRQPEEARLGPSQPGGDGVRG